MDNIKKIFSFYNLSLLLSAILAFILILILLNYPSSLGKKLTTVKIGEHTIQTEIADTAEERTKGLSGRENLAEGQGMIFVFDEAKNHSFWMKDMNFPIDIIWINDGKVVDITHQAQPVEKDADSYKIYKPDKPVKYVLEVNAGYAKNNSLKVGDAVSSPVF